MTVSNARIGVNWTGWFHGAAADSMPVDVCLVRLHPLWTCVWHSCAVVHSVNDVETDTVENREATRKKRTLRPLLYVKPLSGAYSIDCYILICLNDGEETTIPRDCYSPPSSFESCKWLGLQKKLSLTGSILVTRLTERKKTTYCTFSPFTVRSIIYFKFYVSHNQHFLEISILGV